MKSSAIVCAITAAALSFGSVASFAQGNGPDRSNEQQMYNGTPSNGYQGNRQLRNDRREGSREMVTPADRRGDRRDYRNDGRDNRRGYDRRDESRNWDQNRFYYGARSPEFRRGGYIPYEYRNRQYYVNDWRSHHLAAPPYGHQWVQVGSDYVLIAIATGLIANLILSQ